MPTNSVITRGDVGSLIPSEFSNELVMTTSEESAVLSMARRLRDMTRHENTLPVLSSLPTAFFVNGETGLKQTTEMAWTDKVVTAEELAVFVPIAETTLNDATIPIWDEVRPAVAEAIGKAIDEAVLFETNKPTSWPTGIVAGATAAGHTVELGSGDDLYAELLDEGGVISFVEEDGYMPNGHYSHLQMRAKLRGTRDADGNPIFSTGMQEAQQYFLDGNPIRFPTNGAPSSSFPLISGDWQQLVYSIRQDMTWKIFDQGIIQDASGNIVFNLMQQDMLALRVVMRLGFQLPNPINRVNETDNTRYPFAVLTDLL